jgi:predicted DNA-binding protein
MSNRTNRRDKAEAEVSVRASVSFPAGVYRRLEQIASQKKVSIAWVVRDAAERYISDQWTPKKS